MYCSSITHSSALKAAIRVPSLSKCLKPYPIGSCPNTNFNSVAVDTIGLGKFGFLLQSKTLENGGGRKVRYVSSGVCLKPSSRNVYLVKCRSLSSSSFREGEFGGKLRGGRRTRLPWLDSKKAKVAKGGEVVPSRSSWEESAERLDVRTTSKPTISSWEDEVKTRKVTSDVASEPRGSKWVRAVDYKEEKNDEKSESVENEDEVVSDPRWDKIRNKVTQMAPMRSSYERPEVRRWNRQEEWGKKTFKEASESTLPRMIGEGIYGVGPILAALSAGRREFYTLYVQEGLDLSSNNRKKKDKKGFEKILRMAEKNGVTIKDASKHDLNMIVDNRPHQGLVLDASPLEMVRVQELDPAPIGNEKGALWVALDEVTDPQNLGAIIRSAYFFGASGVVLCAKNSAPLSGVVSKASAGALELMELRSCKNMMQFLTSSSENGWRVLGGSVSSKAVPLNKISAGAPTILVLGSEGVGLRPLVERSCTELVKIPGNFPVDVLSERDEDSDRDDVMHVHDSSREDFRSFLAVESLNVSVAAGVMLHHLIGNCHIDENSTQEQVSVSL